MSSSPNVFLADNAAHSTPVADGLSEDIVILPDHSANGQGGGANFFEEKDMATLENELPIEGSQAIPPPAPSTEATEVLNIAPLDTSSFQVQVVNLTPTPNLPLPRNLTPFPSPFPQLLLLPPPESSSTLASNPSPSSSSTPMA